MPSVYTFSRSETEILQELVSIFNSGTGSARELWTMQAELLVEPVGWNALWKLSKQFCKKFEVRFPCIAYVSVSSVDFEQLSADVEVLSVQHEAVRLPESVQDVPLVELWPTEMQKEACINAAATAEFIDLLRFYYSNIWMPWDDQDKVLLPITLEERMKLWSDLHNGTIPMCVARCINLLRTSAINAYEKLKELDSSMCELGDDDDDSLLPPSNITLCAELTSHLDSTMAKWTLYENPIIREQYVNKLAKKMMDTRNKHNVVAVWPGGNVFEFDEICPFLRTLVSSEQSLVMCRSIDDALSILPSQLVLCTSHCEIPELAFPGITICSFKGTTLLASEMRSCLLMLSEQCTVRDVTIQCALVNTAVLMRNGHLELQNCLLTDDSKACESDFAQGLVAISGAKIVIKDCTFDNFYTGLVIHKGAQVELVDCIIRKCGVGIQMYSGAQVSLINTKITDCLEKSIRYESDCNIAETGAKAIEGLNIQNCSIGSGNMQDEILVVQQDFDLV